MLSSVRDLMMIYIDGEFYENVLKGFQNIQWTVNRMLWQYDKKMLFTTLLMVLKHGNYIRLKFFSYLLCWKVEAVFTPTFWHFLFSFFSVICILKFDCVTRKLASNLAI